MGEKGRISLNIALPGTGLPPSSRCAPPVAGRRVREGRSLRGPPPRPVLRRSRTAQGGPGLACRPLLSQFPHLKGHPTASGGPPNLQALPPSPPLHDTSKAPACFPARLFQSRGDSLLDYGPPRDRDRDRGSTQPPSCPIVDTEVCTLASGSWRRENSPTYRDPGKGKAWFGNVEPQPCRSLAPSRWLLLGGSRGLQFPEGSSSWCRRTEWPLNSPQSVLLPGTAPLGIPALAHSSYTPELICPFLQALLTQSSLNTLQ